MNSAKTFSVENRSVNERDELYVCRTKMDAAMKAIVGDHQDFIPFEQRYEWLPEIRYDKRR